MCPRLCHIHRLTRLNPDLSLPSFHAVNGQDVYMNSCFYGNGTSFVESLFEGFGERVLGAPTASTSPRLPVQFRVV